MTVHTEAFFLPAPGGDRYGVFFGPADRPPVCGVLMVPPFAEEANKSRRQMAQIARVMASAGAQVLIGDLKGTGDSAGDFGEASWADWLDDLGCFAAHLRAGGIDHLCLWGLRAGALLACGALEKGLRVESLLLNAPMTSGKLALTQFLRLGAAGELGSNEAARIDTRSLRTALANGLSVEIAGYALSPSLADGLEHAELNLPPDFPGKVAWIDVSSADPPQHAPIATQIMARWEASCKALESLCLQGPAFWQTQEIEAVAALPAANARLLAWLTETGVGA